MFFVLFRHPAFRILGRPPMLSEIQCQPEHVLVLHAALPQRGGVVLQKEVALDVGDAKTQALIEQQLVAKDAGSHIQLLHAAFTHFADGS